MSLALVTAATSTLPVVRTKMRRDSVDAKIERNAWRAKLLHRCWNCHATGLKPGILDTVLGDYGIRDYYGAQYSELTLDEQGLCVDCADRIPAEYRQREE